MQRRSVDLPEPEDPTMQMISPGSTSMSILRKTSWFPKDLLRSHTLRIASSIVSPYSLSRYSTAKA